MHCEALRQRRALRLVNAQRGRPSQAMRWPARATATSSFVWREKRAVARN